MTGLPAAEHASMPGAGTSSVKLALRANQIRANSLAALRADPVAIIGLACRMPGGANSPGALWSLLRDGRQSAGPVPADRWDAAAWHDPDLSAPGKAVTCTGSFLQSDDGLGIAGFDAAYFGISGREADRMDPQQRLLLEVASEALDDAGLDQRALAGSRTGTFIGSYHNDYAQLQHADAEAIDLRTITGTLHSVLASRLSYLLDLRGPALAVDTACSASLVAVHLACQSLRLGESALAIAGGVSLMLTPQLMVMLSKVGFMAPDGRSKTFDAAADGFGRGEGCGVLVLRRLSDAIAAGDRVWAVIRGSAVNQDGRSTLLTAPNGPAQEAMIREALAAAQLEPGRIGFVETHGTGTALGDPIEVEAIAATLGRIEPCSGPCWLGGIKANLGHLEAAAGVAGVIKAVLALRHGAIPPQPNFTRLNPEIRLDGTRLAIPARLVPWDEAGTRPRCSAVSAFGVGGTNAHVILEEAPKLAPAVADTSGGEPAWLLPLSAKSPSALAALAHRWVDFLQDYADAASVADICHSAARRTRQDHRLAVVGRTRRELCAGLGRALRETGGLPRADTSPACAVAFVFCGQGPQWFAMGRELLAAEPVYRDSILAVEAALAPLASWSLREALSRADAGSRLDQTEFAQPALFAVQVALAALWRSWGVVPDAVIGHSVGEIAALHVAGVLDLTDAMRIVFHRGRIMQRATGLGRMASVALGEAAARHLIAPFGNRLAIAAVNASGSVVLSGESEALQAALASCPDHIMLPVNYAFHSAQMEPLRDDLVAAIGAGVTAHPAQIPVYSSVTGGRADGVVFDAAYFGRNMRDTVRFADAVAALPPGMAIVEIGPHPVLAQAIGACIGADGTARKVIAASLRRGRPERETMLVAAASLFTAGVLQAPARVQPGLGRVVSLPAYPWQRRRHWLRPLPAGRAAAGVAPRPAEARQGHELLGLPTRVAGTAMWLYAAGPDLSQDWIGQHCVQGRPILPGAAVMEGFSAAAIAALGGQASLSDFAVHRPIAIDDAQASWQVIVRPAEGATNAGQSLDLEWFEREPNEPGETWRCVASASATRAWTDTGSDAPLPALGRGGGSALDTAAIYARFATLGVAFGPDFRLLTDVVLGPDAATATITLPAGLDASAYGLHPVLLDAAVQLCSLAAGPDEAGDLPRELFLPAAAANVTLHMPNRSSHRHLRVHAKLIERCADTIVCDAAILRQDGTAVATLRRLRLARAATPQPILYGVTWETLAAARPSARHAPYLFLADAGGVADALAARLPGPVYRVLPGTAYARPSDAVWRIDPADPEQFRRLLREAGWQGGTLVHCWSLDAPTGEPGAVDDAAGLGAMLHLAQAAQVGRMVVVTSGAQTVGDREALTGLCPGAAALWGLAGVIRAEEPALALRIIDLDPADNGAEGLLAELLADDAAPSVALRGQKRFRPVLHRHGPAMAAAEADKRLVLQQAGTFENLAWESLSRTSCGPGEVGVRVCAAGLNFRDVLLTLGMYPGNPVPLGAECAGIVETAGEDTPFTVGQRVFGCAAASLAGSVTVPAAFMAAMPENLGMADAAGLPVAFLTALYGLHRLAGLRAGESVLIHAAAGGVGLAAVQIAQRAGARVFATAGSPAKRALLTGMGVEHVMDSRSLAFADQVLAATGFRGVDVVLNSLTGAFIPAGLGALAPRGRFLELGKRDIWRAEDVAALRPDVAYFPYDLGAAAAEDRGLLPPLFAELLAALHDGSLRKLPVTVFAPEDAAHAMRTMAQARHVGKVVIRMAEEPPRAMPRIHPDATYWITGGLGGMGLATAAWLADRGARYLLLSGRTPPGPAARAAIDALEARGVRVDVRLADAADAAAMQAILHAIDPGRRLRGVVHAAGALHDGVLASQDWREAAATMRGKLAGGWVLHRLTRRLSLDVFVLYSAAGVVLGARGQGLYAAANAGLDALARYRRRLGLPALSVAWGSWAGTGMADRAAARGADAWSGRGLRPMGSKAAFDALERLLAAGAGYGVVVDIDWQRFLKTLPEGIDPAFFAPLGARSRHQAGLSSGAAQPDAAVAEPFHAEISVLSAAPPATRRAALLAFLRDRTLAIIGLDPATKLDPRQPLKEIGLDSLMAVELRNVLVRAGGRRLPATLLFDFPSLDGLAGHLMTEWNLGEPAPTATAAAHRRLVAMADEAVAAMTEAEAEALLLAELSDGGAA